MQQLLFFKYHLWLLGSQSEGRRINIEVLSSKEVASVTVDGTKVGLLMVQSVFTAYLSNKRNRRD